MKYVSIDIETTGIDPDNCELIELAAVIDDTNNDDTKTSLEACPTFRFRAKEPTYKGEPRALNMHAKFFADMAKLPHTRDRVHKASHCDGIGYRCLLLPDLRIWLRAHKVDPENFVVAGKNFANFDARFIRRLPPCPIRWHHRILDPGSMWLRKGDTTVPDTKTCIDRAGINVEDLPGEEHAALHDALVVCLLVRKGLSYER